MLKSISNKYYEYLGVLLAGKVPVVSLRGVIHSTSSPAFSKNLNEANVNPFLERAFDNRSGNIQAVALLINSPGGSPAQSSLIYKRIKQLSKEKNIKVMSFVEDVAASGGYFLACAGEEIYVNEASIVGSIGVISAGFGFQKLIKNYEIERRILKQGKYKGILMDPFSEMKPEDVEQVNDMQKEVFEHIKNSVIESRGEKLKRTSSEDIFSGRIFTGRRAMELGLVDGIGGVHSVLREKFGKDIKLDFIKAGGLFPDFMGNYSTRSLTDSVVATLEDRALWSQYGF